MKGKTLFYLIILTLTILAILGTMYGVDRPECYMTIEYCSFGYDSISFNICGTKLTNCCRKPHYLLQENFGYTCQYVFNESFVGNLKKK